MTEKTPERKLMALSIAAALEEFDSTGTSIVATVLKFSRKFPGKESILSAISSIHARHMQAVSDMIDEINILLDRLGAAKLKLSQDLCNLNSISSQISAVKNALPYLEGKINREIENREQYAVMTYAFGAYPSTPTSDAMHMTSLKRLSNSKTKMEELARLAEQLRHLERLLVD